MLDSTTSQLVARVPRTLHRAVKLAAAEADERLNDWVADALTSHLATVTGRPVPTADETATRRALASPMYAKRA